MTDKQQPEAFCWATELAMVRDPVTLTVKEAREVSDEMQRMHAENETLRTGYAAARLEIESLKAQLAAQQEAREPAKLSDEQIKAHGDKASRMMARDLTRFDAACEVDKYLREQGAPGYYRHRMSIVLFGNAEGTEAARAPDTDPQQAPAAPAVGYPPLPRVGAIGYASVVDIQIYAKTLTIGPHLPGVRDIALWTTDQMRAYVDADRAMRAAQQPGAAYAALPDADSDYMRKVVAVAVTVLFDGYKEDVTRVFSTGELSEFVTITAAMGGERVEDIYRRAWDLLSLPVRASHGQAPVGAATPSELVATMLDALKHAQKVLNHNNLPLECAPINAAILAAKAAHCGAPVCCGKCCAAEATPSRMAAQQAPAPACWIPPEREGEYHSSLTITAYREPMAGWEPLYRTHTAQAAPAAVAGPSADGLLGEIEDWLNDLRQANFSGYVPQNVFSEAGDFVDRIEQLRDPSAPTTQPAPRLPERDASIPAEQQGLFRKFDVRRVDGTDKPGGKHHGCTYFVLDIDHDPCARPALAAYAAACEATHPALSAALRTKWGAVPAAQPAPQQEPIKKGGEA